MRYLLLKLPGRVLTQVARLLGTDPPAKLSDSDISSKYFKIMSPKSHEFLECAYS